MLAEEILIFQRLLMLAEEILHYYFSDKEDLARHWQNFSSVMQSISVKLKKSRGKSGRRHIGWNIL
jgi:hypothetical protein